MPKATIRETRLIEVACPHCGEGWSRVDHLLSDSPRHGKVGPWFCDECGFGFTLKVNAADDVELEPAAPDECSVPCYDLLVLPPQPKPVFVLVESKDYRRKIGGPAFDGKAYHYDEHTCPTNWTGDIAQIISDGDHDPHGLFQYVGSVDKPRSNDTEQSESESAQALISQYQPS